MEAESSRMAAIKTNALPTRKKRKLEVMTVTKGEIKEAKPLRRGKVGKLAELMSLPLDILFEVFGHLRPYDLLRLARMTKEFRRVLMSRTSISVWKSARANIPGFPECPPGVSEPEWANLAFDPHCHFCLTQGIRTVEWRLRIRICAKCAKEHLGEYHPFNPFDIDNSDPNVDVLVTLIPSRQGKRHRQVLLLTDYVKVKNEYYLIQDVHVRQQFIHTRHRIVEEINQHSKLCEVWATGQSSDRYLELQMLKDERRKAIIGRLEALGWGKDVAGIRYPDSLADHKLVKQPQRLTDRIWSRIQGPIIEFMAQMRVKRLAREHAEAVLDRKRIAVRALRTFKNSHLPCTDIMPEPVDFCDFPPVKAILDQPTEADVDESSFADISIPDLIEAWRKDVHLQVIRLMKISPDDVRMVARAARRIWNDVDSEDELMEEMEEILHAGPLLDDDEILSKMKLATTVFRCSSCTDYDPWLDSDSEDSETSFSWSDPDDAVSLFSSSFFEPLFYPQVLGHHCLTRTSPRIRALFFTPDPSKDLRFYASIRKKWTCCGLRLDRRLQQTAEGVVVAAGMDPETTTAEKMNQLDVWFVCLKCAYPSYCLDGLYQGFAFGWRDAVKHHAGVHGYATPKWQTLTTPEVEETRINERDICGLSPDPPSPDDTKPPLHYPVERVWLCAHCRDLPLEREATILESIKRHLSTAHEISEPEVDRDYFKAFEAPPLFPRPCEVLLEVNVPDLRGPA